MEKRTISNSQETQQLLKDLNIEYKLYTHQEAPTLDVLTKVTKFDNAPYIKNMFYSDKKSYFYVLAKHDTKVDNSFWKGLNLKANKMRFAKEEDLQSIIGCVKGNVNPFAVVNDHGKKISKFVIDNNLMNEEYWAGHPMDNTESLEVKKSDILSLFEKVGRNITPFDLDKVHEEPKQEKEQKKVAEKKQPAEGETLLKITTKKSDDLSDWYQQVLLKSEMLDYYEISGCYILRPWAFNIWEHIQKHLDGQIKEAGVDNTYFPIFVTQKALETEKDHVEGFSPEVAWVTKSGQSDLNEPIAIRPTSETIMYPAFRNWIKGHRDLPIKINQWSNVVRWEFKHPTPFIRTREFLWQEGHTAHATKEEADEMTFQALEFYRSTYEDLLAVPVIKGIKSEGEKFPGGDFTTTVETIIPENGRAIQAATSHQLGQNFAKMFKIEYEDEQQKKQMIWQTSWGFTTRSIGVMILYHGDDKGLVIPPRVAHTQVVIVPIQFKDTEKFNKQLDKAYEIKKSLARHGIRAQVDDRPNYSPGWKYSHWEVKGVPIRLELGPKDFDKQEFRAVVRATNEKYQIKWDGIEKELDEKFTEITKSMLEKARAKLDSKIKEADNWQDFMEHLNQRNAVLTPWCNEEECEDEVKRKSGEESKLGNNENENLLTGAAKSLCIPIVQKSFKKKDQCCFACGRRAKKWVYWGRSY